MTVLESKVENSAAAEGIRLPGKYFNLEKTFECGQAFRWRKIDVAALGEAESGFEGVASGRYLRALQLAGDVILETSQDDYESFWKSYFDLETDYAAIEQVLLERDPSSAMACAAEFGRGIRILRQDPWEMVITFILSGNNNIPRIKGSIEALADRFGSEITEAGSARVPHEKMKGFPAPEILAGLSLDQYRQAGAGYRDQYLLATAQKVASGEADLEAWGHLEDTALMKALLTLPGVGEKVASCIMLFGYGRRAAFPVDTWVAKMMRQLYFNHEASAREIKTFAESRFGDQAGYAQQLLFHWGRNSEMEA
ncbi:DNA-3-methyladenine glycosylase family protein [Acidaminobacter hydrogenoformans]|uniref:DNA-(apurinic or apyrimidinic site) lyase n=1 Tax=Acidaminobacter hydrogenoformans DSM 2784 TaxID=1120920 RepID=A0A1G5S6A1_9FIRM|nr:DNA glycosylase [Acidaminobacter hydrogenoformans]SCZ81617.1 N-glycosylase/DNA lyase [Acidaminobacter hydrogenoformans DSM 2784]